MAGYRLYCIDQRDRITQRVDFDAPDDRAAIAYARQKHANTACEIWELGRKVAVIPRGGFAQLIEAA